MPETPHPEEPTRPDGLYVDWQGRTWEAATTGRPPGSVKVFADAQVDPEFTTTLTGRWARVLPRTQAQPYRLATYCRWRGAPFRVEGRTPSGALRLGYLGRDETEARTLGLTKAAPGVYVGTAAPTEVTDLRQERTELTD
jgi:hypothetical protein